MKKQKTTTKGPVTTKAWLLRGLSSNPSPGLWYLGPALEALEAVGSLIIDTVGQL